MQSECAPEPLKPECRGPGGGILLRRFRVPSLYKANRFVVHHYDVNAVATFAALIEVDHQVAHRVEGGVPCLCPQLRSNSRAALSGAPLVRFVQFRNYILPRQINTIMISECFAVVEGILGPGLCALHCPAHCCGQGCLCNITRKGRSGQHRGQSDDSCKHSAIQSERVETHHCA